MFTSTIITLFLATLATAAPGILTIGDSTVSATKGWGNGFCADTKGLTRCLNIAVGGTTTVTWLATPQFDTMITNCKHTDMYATIQFGHNDQKVMGTAVFNAHLESLVNKVKTAGCTPILVTPLARRNFSPTGRLTDNLGPYANETIAVAKKLNLHLLPLLADAMAYLQKLGQTNANKFNADPTDTTHLNAMGNIYFGRMVADEIKKVPELTSHIVADATLSGKIAAGVL